jgi:hypothetical protein
MKPIDVNLETFARVIYEAQPVFDHFPDRVIKYEWEDLDILYPQTKALFLVRARAVIDFAMKGNK